MSDRDSKKERIFGCGAQDAKARLQGRDIIQQGQAQSVSSMGVLQGRTARTPGTDNLKNN